MTTQSKQEELDSKVRQILVNYMGLEKFEDGNALLRTIIKNSASATAELINSEVTAALEELEKFAHDFEVTDLERMEYAGKTPLKAVSLSMLQTLKEKYKNE